MNLARHTLAAAAFLLASSSFAASPGNTPAALAQIRDVVEYAGRPNGVAQKVLLTALGNSGATRQAGLRAPVLVLYSFDEFRARGAEAKGKIVLFDGPFDQLAADRGLAGPAYGTAVAYRGPGPRMAAEAGAVAALVRSVLASEGAMNLAVSELAVRRGANAYHLIARGIACAQMEEVSAEKKLQDEARHHLERSGRSAVTS